MLDQVKCKEQIVSISMELLNSGLVIESWGNVSTRCHDNQSFVITPSAVNYQDLKATDIVTMDLNGKTIEGERKPSSEYKLHLEILRNRKEINAVIHTHSIYATAFAVAGKSIPVAAEDLAQVIGGSVEVAEHRMPGSQELADICLETMGEKNAVLLANHGLVAVGSSLKDALRVARVVEKNAQITLLASQLGNVSLMPVKMINELRVAYLEDYKP